MFVFQVEFTGFGVCLCVCVCVCVLSHAAWLKSGLTNGPSLPVGKLSWKFSPNEDRLVNISLGGGDPSH